MTLSQTSLAAATGVSVKNVQFQPSANNVPRKIFIVGTYDPLITTIADEVPALVTSPEDAGSQFGFGFMIHRLAVQAFAGSNGVETWVIPQAEAGGSAAAAGDIDFAGSTGIESGTIWLYIAGISANFTVLSGDTADAVATKAVAAINATKELPVTAAVNGVTTSQVDFTSKSNGTWGNFITLRFNIKAGESLPVGVTAAVTDMATGAGDPDIADALDGTGTGDDANAAFFTDGIHGYGQTAATLDAISTYVGAGNIATGLYDKLVSRPFRVLTGDTVADTAGLSALIALGDGRKLDRANGVIAVPGSANHPSEIAAQAMGIMAKINNDRAEQSYIGQAMTGIDPGAQADRWTSDYDNRDTAVKSGVSPTKISNGVVTMQNVLTFYHPDNVPVDSNGYRSMRNVSILQNIMDNVRVTFEQEKWQGISIVQDVTRVTNTTDRQKARDIDAVKDDLVALARAFEGKAWIYTASFTIDKLKEAGSVTIRPGSIGFDNILSVILSGEGGIIDTVIEFDTSIAVLTA
jgi:phage tail sheath gpL-like